MLSIQRIANAPIHLKRPLLLSAKRSFFASSTDHTRLLADSQVYRLDGDADHCFLYVLAAGGTDPELVRKVRPLHLARLLVDTKQNIMWGAKVVNRTLGTPQHVCGKLVDAALRDMKKGNPVFAKSTLHGLSEWVLKRITQQKKDSIPPSLRVEDDVIKALKCIAENKSDDSIYEAFQAQWELVGKDFLNDAEAVKAGESGLYQSKGATLVEIQHRVDTSEFSDTCAGTMALYRF